MPLHMFLASELTKNLHAADLLPCSCRAVVYCMKQQGILFLNASISLACFETERLFSKHTVTEQKIHHAYKKKSV